MKDFISYEDFAKLNIKIGTIKEASRVEKSNNLLKLLIDVGEEDLRQVISGIAEWYSAGDLIGKQLPVLVNLEPKKIFGLESQGMILAGDSEDYVVMIHPDKDVASGSVIR